MARLATDQERSIHPARRIRERLFRHHGKDVPRPQELRGSRRVPCSSTLVPARLIFVESKEEEELSLLRRERLAVIRRSFEENEEISARIRQEIRSGSPKTAADWEEFRRKRHGK